jgi:hypothetical protein
MQNMKGHNDENFMFIAAYGGFTKEDVGAQFIAPAWSADTWPQGAIMRFNKLMGDVRDLPEGR